MNFVLALILAVQAALAPVAAADPVVEAGRRIAERECGACHAVGRRGASPLADAPRFREMSPQLPPSAFAAELERRAHVIHPRMPALDLDADERAALIAYWASLRAKRPI